MSIYGVPDVVVIVACVAWVLTNLISYVCAMVQKQKTVVKVIAHAEAVGDKREKALKTYFKGKLAAIEGKIPKMDRFEVGLVDLKAQVADIDVAGLHNEVGNIKNVIQNFEEGFQQFRETTGNNMTVIAETLNDLPGQMGNQAKIQAMSAAGVEKRVIQDMLENQGEDLETAASMMEALATENPDVIAATALKKVADFQPSDKWMEDHPLLTLALEAGKPMVMQHMQELFDPGGRVGKAQGQRALSTSIFG